MALTETEIRRIFREELQAFFAAQFPVKPAAKVIPLSRQVEIRNLAQKDMHSKRSR